MYYKRVKQTDNDMTTAFDQFADYAIEENVSEQRQFRTRKFKKNERRNQRRQKQANRDRYFDTF